MIFITSLELERVAEDVLVPSVNAVWGQYSELFFLLSAYTYAVAFLFFCWDFVTAYRFDMIGTQQGSEVTAEETADSDVRDLAVVGAADAKAQDSCHIRRNSDSGGADTGAAGHGSLSELRQPPDKDSVSRPQTKNRPRARIAVALTTLGFIINAAAVCLRGAAAGRAPWGNMYEFCTTGAFVVVGVFLLLSLRKDIRFVGSFVLGLVLVMLVSATLVFYVPAGRLVPALNSYWIIIHVSLAIVAAALFTVTFVMAVFQLLQSRRSKKTATTGRDPLKFMDIVPSARVLEDLAYRINVFAFILWSITIIFGAIWAESAWGRFWGWDPKEVWSFIIWLVYAAYLHARSTRGWTGARSAWLSIIGYVCIIFNFTIVNIFFSGLHSYGGV